MKSIRSTLLLYFLALEALVLGIMSFYVYEITSTALRTKDTKIILSLEARHENRVHDVSEKFDEETLRRVQQMARFVVHQWGQPLQKIYPLGAMAEMTQPFGPVASIAWLGQGMDDRLASQIQRTRFIQVLEQFVPPEAEAREQEYYQVWSARRRSLQRSHTLALVNHNLRLDDEIQKEVPDLYNVTLTDVDLAGQTVRQATFKVPLVFYRSAAVGPFGLMPLRSQQRRPQSSGRNNRSSTQDNPPPNNAPPGGFHFWLYVQYARDTSVRDARIAAFRQELIDDQERVREETRMALTYLRDKLILLSLATFALTVIGGTWLVHHGLRPLGRIADAVSRVSEKDFHLRIADQEVPVELIPIVRRLQEALHSLEKAFAHEKQAVADISHELRTPIASLIATMQVSLRKQRSTEDYRTAIQNCMDIAQHLNQLVEQLLTLARLDVGVIPLQTEVVNVTELAEQCADMIHPLAEAKEMKLHYHPMEMVETETDAGKLKEIVTNLLSNAVQYNRPRGEITLEVQTVGERVCVAVTDTGIGIPAESLQHLFERFYRADPSRHADTVHAGLGLAIVKGYVDLLDGTIEVDSEPGRGSNFRVWLPLRVPVEAMTVS